MKEPKLSIAFVDSEGKTYVIDSATDEEISDGVKELGEVLVNRFFIKISPKLEDKYMKDTNKMQVDE
jgi:hypothetical protein